MCAKGKDFNRNGIFPTRFRELNSKKYRTLDELGEIFGASRQTVASWMDGRSIPNANALARMARFYNVSADYLLGLSDMVSPDVSLRAAAEYTGLSEKAVERLHDGLIFHAFTGLTLPAGIKQDNLAAASALIESEDFVRIVHNLSEITKEAYLEKIIIELDAQCPKTALQEEEPDEYATEEEKRKNAAADLIRRLQTEDMFHDKTSFDRAKSMIEESIVGNLLVVFLKIEETNNRYQFLASKAFSGYIDRVVEEGHSRAELHIKGQ